MNSLNKDIMRIAGFKSLTSVQSQVLEQINKNRDMIVRSATGTGKTHAFLFALCEKINFNVQETQALILAPTRELAMQIFEFSKDLRKVDESITIDLAIGGMDNSRLKRKIEKQPHILIATPGKMLDILSWNTLRVDTIKMLILDEMDMIFDYGFSEEINSIASRLLDSTQFLLFSATLPRSLEPFIKKYLNHPIEIHATEERMKPRIEFSLIHRKHWDLNEAVTEVLRSIEPLLAVVFANRKEEVSEIAQHLRENGFECLEIHGDISDRERKQTISRLRSGQVRYIVATDLAARGIDLPEISHVINANLPAHDISFFMHRAGRTGRSGREGYCITLVTDSDQNTISRIRNQNNVSFKFKRIQQHVIVDARPFFNFERRHRRLDPEIQAKLKRKNVKVKPRYKKKHKNEIEKLMRHKRREIIRDDIRRQKKERNKERQKSMQDL